MRADTAQAQIRGYSLGFRTIPKQLQDYKLRQALDAGDFTALLAEYEGAKSLNAIAAMLRHRGRVATRRMFWVFGALLGTIVLGLTYYIGLPIILQISDGTRRAYQAELNIQEATLIGMDRRRDEIFGRIQEQLESITFKLSTDGKTESMGFSAEDGISVVFSNQADMDFVNAIITQTLEPGVSGDAQAMSLFDATETSDDGFSLHSLAEHLNTEEAELRTLLAERQPTNARRDAALESLNQIRAGGFSLAQRRQDFQQFIEICQNAAPKKVSDIETFEKDGDRTSETRTQAVEPAQITTECLDVYKFQLGLQEPDLWQVLSERLPQAILLLFLLATLSPLYRYNLRLAGFHHSRADLIEMIALRSAEKNEFLSEDELASFVAFADALAADKVAFGKDNTPTDQAVELARAMTTKG